MPVTISNGQTNLLLSDFIKRAKRSDVDFNKQQLDGSDAVDFIIGAQIALPPYAASYAGRFYIVPSNSSVPVAFSAAKEDTALGKFYEEDVPADCMDAGIISVEVFFGSAGVVDPSLIVHSPKESWDLLNGTKVFWEMYERKVAYFIPLIYSSSTPLKHAESYRRFPTLPSVVSDPVDAPAEDESGFQNAFINALQKV